MREYAIHPRDGVETTVLLSDEEAAARGLSPVEDKPKSAKVSGKSRTVANKSDA